MTPSPEKPKGILAPPFAPEPRIGGDPFLSILTKNMEVIMQRLDASPQPHPPLFPPHSPPHQFTHSYDDTTKSHLARQPNPRLSPIGWLKDILHPFNEQMMLQAEQILRSKNFVIEVCEK